MQQALILEELCDITDVSFCLNAGHMLVTQNKFSLLVSSYRASKLTFLQGGMHHPHRE